IGRLWKWSARSELLAIAKIIRLNDLPISALGQKRTYAVPLSMSAMGHLADTAHRTGTSAGFQSVLRDHWSRGWSCKEFDERHGAVRLLRPTQDPTGKHGDMLNVRRQRAKNLNPLHGNEFTQLVEADFGIAASDHLAHWLAGLHRGQLRFDLLGDTKFLEHTDEVDAARSSGIGN